MTRRTIRTAATCSALALATALAAAPAAAQSFQGNATVTFGSATVTTAPNVTDVQVNSTSAVIDWNTFDSSVANGAPILFQPNGTTATFHNNDTTQNSFAVLNRIVPADATRPIIFDGTVISELRSQLAPSVPGGTVFFYSPGGIIVGANAVFNVGNLGLTTAAPVVDGSGNWYTGNQVQFAQAAPGTSVRIDPGAQIIATAESSYVAAFAPQVVQAGTINVNGQVALVAAEAGTITFSPDGLFDIQVSIGSDETFAIDHSGTTTGPASSGAGDNHRIYMVAIPKNTAIQIAIGRGSEIGFDVAGAADVAGNAVILSAGRNIVDGGIAGVAGGPDGASIDINDSSSASSAPGINFTSAVTGSATNDVTVNVFHQTNFASDATFEAEETALVGVGTIPNEAPGALTVGGNFTLSTNRYFPVSTAPGDAGDTFVFISDGATADIGGDLTLSSNAAFDTDLDGVVTGGDTQLYLDTGGSLDVGGNLLMEAGAFTNTTVPTLDAIAGTAQAFLFGGSNLNVAGVGRILTYGLAGFNNGFSGSGADGTGGFTTLSINQGSSATFNELNLAADGVGGLDTGAGAGNGFGGTAQIDVSGVGSTLTVQQANVTGDFNLGQLDLISAEGIGGATGISGATGGTGTGGFALLLGTDSATINLPTDPLGPITLITARGYGGGAAADGTTGGVGTGGNLALALDNSAVNAENLVLSVAGIGGSTTPTAPGTVNGGDGVGGSRSISIINGSTYSGSLTGGASGGAGGNGNALGTGGDGSGGSTFFELDNSIINVTGSFIVIAQAQGGLGNVGGNASAGTVNAQIRNGSTVNIASGGEFSFSANAFGQTNTSIIDSTVGGNATGGSVQVTVQDSTITGPGGFGVVAVGSAGFARAQGGVGTGGFASLAIENSSISVSEIAAIANGTGGDLVGNVTSAGGSSGSGVGGTAGINLTNSTVTADITEVRAEGTAGFVDAAGFSGLTGGTGTGGTAFFQALGGTSDVTTPLLYVDSQGAGGRISAGAGTAGNGTAGQSFVRSSNGSFTINGSVEVVAEGDAGSAAEGGIGGAAFGGNSDVTAGTGGSMVINGQLTVDASAEGGDGTTGGAATGGSVVLNADAQTLTVNGQTFLTANADGGFGGIGGTGAGGAATGGNVFVVAQNGGTLTFADDANADAFATGGGSSDGDGGAATGGSATYAANSSGMINLSNALASLTADSQATGGDSIANGNGGDAVTGTTYVVADGGSITIAGSLGVLTEATGGAGTNGGSATGSTDTFFADAAINTFNGTLSVTGSTGVAAIITGGDGQNGGTGGAALGGATAVNARSSVNGPSLISLGDTFVSSSATGGNGGSGAGSLAGGAGGDAQVNFASVTGNAGNGNLVINGTLQIEAVAEGGAGGDGGTGGAGGNALGGTVQIGTVNGLATADNTGSAQFVGDVFAAGSGIGGDGGAGSTGAGGAGGDGENGSAAIVVRGSPVTIGNAQLLAYGIGGNGGVGASGDGAGGDGIVGNIGGIGVLAANRVGVPEQRGTLIAGTITGQAIAIGGSGSTPGAELVGEFPSLVQFTSADGNIGTLDFFVSGTQVVGTIPAQILLTDATVTVSDFSFTTPTDLILALDGATLNTDFFLLQAREIVLPETLPSLPGTVNITSGLQIFVDPGASIRTYTDFNTGFGVGFTVDGDFQTGDFTAAGDIAIESLTGSITTRDLTGNNVGLTAAQNISVSDVEASGDILLDAIGGTVTTDSLAGNSVSVFAAQGILTGDIDANGNIVLQTDTGTISTGLLSGVNVNVAGAQDIVIGDFASDGDVFLSSSGGSLTTGNVSGVNVNLSAATNLSAQNVTATGDINALAGGTITVNGVWTGLDATIISNDITITSAGQITVQGEVSLASSNPNGMFIGDGTSGSGYLLDNAEFSRITGGDIAIEGDDTANLIDVTIGNLNIAASQITGGVESGISFDVEPLGSGSETSGSGIRVDGNVLVTGAGDGFEIEFETDLFELNAASGSVAISGNTSGSLAGEIEIEATHIHVASEQILLKLREDPLYTGREAELNAPAQVQRPEGVLRARGLVLYPEGTLYIQNTGTAANPAGFYTTVENSDIEPPGFDDPSAEPVDVIINGRFQTESGDVTGRDAFDLLIENAESSAGFTSTSQINACSISTSVCSNVAETPPPTNTSEIAALTEDQAEEEPFDTEEEEDAEEEASSPITPPVVLINSRPLNPDVDVTDPVSGTGNPALIDATLSDDAQGDDQ